MPETIDGSANPSANARDVSGSLTITHVVYALHGLAPFTFWTLAVVAMIILETAVGRL